MHWVISLGYVHVANFAFLSLLCAAIYVSMRSQPALAWLAAALLCGAVEALILSLAGGTARELAAITLLLPSAYLCFAQATRLAVGERRQHWGVVGAVFALVCLALLLLALDVPFVYQTIPFQLACALAILDSVHRLRGGIGRRKLDTCLAALLGCVAAVFLVRVPLFPLLFDAGTSYAAVKASNVERTLLMVSGLVTLPAVFLLLARIIGGVIAGYRARAERDGLTGLFNRETFERAFAASREEGGALVLCDLDHFKQVNDGYGHAAGDAVIRAFASLLAATGHPAGRLGGEEFALYVPGVTAEQAARLAERIRGDFHALHLPGLPPGQRMSASFGIAERADGAPLQRALAAADAALYRAKAAGRNRLAIATPDEVTASKARRHRRAA